MLVLSRKKGEQIRIGENITITVHRMSGNRVSIGIEAPPSCRITRGELQAIVEAFNDKDAEASTPAPRKIFTPTSRILRNVPADTGGENRVAPHLSQLLRTSK